MQRRNFLAGLAATATLAGCDTVPSGTSGAPARRLIVLRHTERTGEDLNAAGLARAAALPAALAGEPINAIFVPAKQRNKDSAAPLAQARGIELQEVQATDLAGALFRRQPTGTSVWVGNGDNIAALWEQIGASGDAPLDYGDIAIVTMQGDRAGAIRRLRFGD